MGYDIWEQVAVRHLRVWVRLRGPTGGLQISGFENPTFGLGVYHTTASKHLAVFG